MGRRRRIAEWTTHSPSETVAIGCQIGKELKTGAVLCFFGDLAAGKTTLIKGIVEQTTGLPQETVNSPTFIYLNTYTNDNGLAVHHFDLYRLHNSADFFALGFEEYFTAGDICCIEWSERIEDILPKDHLAIHIQHLGQDMRSIKLIS